MTEGVCVTEGDGVMAAVGVEVGAGVVATVGVLAAIGSEVGAGVGVGEGIPAQAAKDNPATAAKAIPSMRDDGKNRAMFISVCRGMYSEDIVFIFVFNGKCKDYMEANGGVEAREEIRL